ncbi:hypothetical protein O6H91_07G129600 [Diphasiastrum complanatum]|uniref:Uncharacterized protein n=1 Tax=Diphasiastrum complanatum TaxID=34168 RepID=A0ACC2D9I5_DIPCM|nr:hypothetical protein O6H91_07G129600 [Diphasiastrum complanatum]
MEARRLCRILILVWAIQTVLLMLTDKTTANPLQRDTNATSGKKVIMDYIGASGIDITVTGVPITDSVDFYFILAFAIDASPTAQPQNGIFEPYWSTKITPKSIAALKLKHRNVKVLISLAGDTQYVSNTKQPQVYWYDPADPDLWVKNGVQSLTRMAKQWYADGIDVNYENFHANNNKKFTYCLGQLITQLKQKQVITVATMAPYLKTTLLYQDLYHNYSHVFDYLNYQFYADDLFSVSQYVNYFREVVGKYRAYGKTTASIQLYNQGLQGKKFTSVVTELLKNDSLPGVMIWDLDASSKKHYVTETALQALFSA